jgi:hypothetical protein
MTPIPTSKKIIWLASYPKSGNTWFRTFLTALLGNQDLDINRMKTDGIFSSRVIFEYETAVNSALLLDKEIKNLMPQVFINLTNTVKREKLFIKIHDAYTYNSNGLPIVPEQPTIGAVYFIRNPLDVAGSFANHSNISLDKSIKIINSAQGSLSNVLTNSGELNINRQFKQLMLSWSGHVLSWTTNVPFPVLVLRYEDMLANSLPTFSKAANFMGLGKDESAISEALEKCKFERLQEMEKQKGFNEKNKLSPVFFRQGKAESWKTELTTEQVKLIVKHHGRVMRHFGYTLPDV